MLETPGCSIRLPWRRTTKYLRCFMDKHISDGNIRTIRFDRVGIANGLGVRQEIIGAVVKAESKILIANTDIGESVRTPGGAQSVIAIKAVWATTTPANGLPNGIVVHPNDHERSIAVGFKAAGSIEA